MKKIMLITSLWISLFVFKNYASRIYVDKTHTGGTQTGASWATAFSGFQDGINAANAGDTVWVAKGTYTPAYDSSFHMKEGVKLLGGFTNTDTSILQRDRVARPTILKGNNSNVIRNISNVLTNDALIDGFVITNGRGANGAGMWNVSSSPTISNCLFTKNIGEGGIGMFNSEGSEAYIVNCAFDSNYVKDTITLGFGLGIVNYYHSNVRILNCTFTRNTGKHGYGGGISNFQSETWIKGCTFSDNILDVDMNGGAVLSQFGSSTIDSCFFFNNHAGWFGGAVEFYGDSNSTMRNCVLKNNSAWLGGALSIVFCQEITIAHNLFEDNRALNPDVGTGWGGAVYNHSDSSKIYNCSFIRNKATHGGGFLNLGSYGSVFANCLFAGNTADSLGGAAANLRSAPNYSNASYSATHCSFIQNRSPSPADASFYNDSLCTIAVDNSIIWGNTGGIANHDATATYTTACSLVQGAPANAALHNLDGTTDPLFVDTAAGDFRLRFNSPCINRGLNDAIPAAILTDLAGEDRIVYDTTDIGAYEYRLKIDLGKDTLICNEAGVTLDADNIGSAFLWSTGDTTQSILADTAGTYIVAVSNTWGSVSDTFTLSEGTPPVVDLGGDVTTGMPSYTLDAGNPGAVYWWNTGAATQQLTITTSGLYAVIVTNAQGCSTSDSAQVTFVPVGIADPRALSASVTFSPNPAHETITVHTADGLHLPAVAVLTHVNGAVLKTIVLKSRIQTLSLAGLVPGIYFLKLAGGKSVKFIKE